MIGQDRLVSHGPPALVTWNLITKTNSSSHNTSASKRYHRWDTLISHAIPVGRYVPYPLRIPTFYISVQKESRWYRTATCKCLSDDTINWKLLHLVKKTVLRGRMQKTLIIIYPPRYCMVTIAIRVLQLRASYLVTLYSHETPAQFHFC
jgi:hypothetical protein